MMKYSLSLLLLLLLTQSLTFLGFLFRYFLIRVIQDVFLAAMILVPGPEAGPEARLPLLLFSLLAWIRKRKGMDPDSRKSPGIGTFE